ncbi:hypothetical protein AB0C12_32890 [Actinoplanes sp. NPDC048967]|uniref:hypothetical protein n=1 Tax=Actinoplanes sp. NPDC048967 TaxID=3155269 RepID=UPI0033EC1927
MSSATSTGSTVGVLARQEIRNYLRHKLFWFGAALVLVVDVVMVLHLDDDPSSSGSYMIAPAALLGVLGVVVMFGLTRRSDRAAEAAGVVAVPERTRTLALAGATVVPFALALVSFVAAVVAWNVHPPADYVVPPGVSDTFVYAQMFGDGVLCAVGGPLLGLLLARYLPRRGVAAVASVVLVLVTILLQGGLFPGGQPYRVFWFRTYFLSQSIEGGPGQHHFTTFPGNPYIWIGYLVVVCALGLVLAVRHDPDADRATLDKVAGGLVVAAVALGVLAMTVGFTTSIVHPAVCPTC